MLSFPLGRHTQAQARHARARRVDRSDGITQRTVEQVKEAYPPDVCERARPARQTPR